MLLLADSVEKVIFSMRRDFLRVVGALSRRRCGGSQRRRLSQSKRPAMDLRQRPISTVRGNAATRPQSGVKPTCQRHCSTDAFDPDSDIADDHNNWSRYPIAKSIVQVHGSEVKGNAILLWKLNCRGSLATLIRLIDPPARVSPLGASRLWSAQFQD